MENWQILLGVNAFLVTALGAFVKIWMNGLRDDIKSVKEDLKGKASVETCRRIHEGVDKLLHRHAASGSAGEAVPK
jgi:hypothetical protein